MRCGHRNSPGRPPAWRQRTRSVTELHRAHHEWPRPRDFADICSQAHVPRLCVRRERASDGRGHRRFFRRKRRDETIDIDDARSDFARDDPGLPRRALPRWNRRAARAQTRHAHPGRDDARSSVDRSQRWRECDRERARESVPRGRCRLYRPLRLQPSGVWQTRPGGALHPPSPSQKACASFHVLSAIATSEMTFGRLENRDRIVSRIAVAAGPPSSPSAHASVTSSLSPSSSSATRSPRACTDDASPSPPNAAMTVARPAGDRSIASIRAAARVGSSFPTARSASSSV